MSLLLLFGGSPDISISPDTFTSTFVADTPSISISSDIVVATVTATGSAGTVSFENDATITPATFVSTFVAARPTVRVSNPLTPFVGNPDRYYAPPRMVPATGPRQLATL